MFVKTKSGIINLAHAFEFSYEPEIERLTVWWSMPLPDPQQADLLADVYSSARHCYYGLSRSDWAALNQRI